MQSNRQWQRLCFIAGKHFLSLLALENSFAAERAVFYSHTNAAAGYGKGYVHASGAQWRANLQSFHALAVTMRPRHWKCSWNWHSVGALRLGAVHLWRKNKVESQTAKRLDKLSCSVLAIPTNNKYMHHLFYIVLTVISMFIRILKVHKCTYLFLNQISISKQYMNKFRSGSDQNIYTFLVLLL